MKYVGNTDLSPQIQERIQNTFSQTLSLAEEGNRQEALLGCDFILRLDPLFEPARRLQERLNESEGPVSIDGLMDDATEPAEPPAQAAAEEVATPVAVEEPPPSATPAAAAPQIEVGPLETPPASAAQPAVEMVASIDEESVDIAELIADAPSDEMPLTNEAETPAEVGAGPAEAASPPATGDLPARLAMLFEQRSFQELLSLANQNPERVAADPELQQMVGLAGERLEAEPYVRNFVDSAQTAKENEDFDGARSYLEKAKELDASHPDIGRLEADIDAASRVEPPEAFVPVDSFEPQPLVETPPLVGDEEPVAATEAAEHFETTAEPEPPPAVPPLMAEPAARLDTESEQRIDTLLKEGQQSFEDGQFQAAIDAWSRIFLIDIDHAEASRRIELARKLKAEVERQIEEAFHEGISMLESGNEEQAKEAFEKVLEMQPGHMGARDYLDKLDSGTLGVAVPDHDLAPSAEETAVAEVEAFESAEAIEMAPPHALPAEEEVAPADFDIPARPAPRKRSFLLIGTAVFILVLAVGWFVYSNWDRFFPASTPDSASATEAPEVDPIEKALELHEAGNTPMAINVLRRLNPGHEQYSEALDLIATWEAASAPAPPPVDVAPSEQELARRGELLSQAEQAMAQGENLLALGLIDEAAGIIDLGEEEMALRIQAEDSLEPLRDERELFDQGDWEYALPNLWRIHDADPENQDAIRLMVDSYYNLGLRDLQRGDAKSALEKFAEAQNLDGEDEDLDRLAEFADAYTQRPTDMLFRIFVKYQRFR